MKNKKESSGQLSLFEDLEEKKNAFEIIDGKKSCDSSNSSPDLLLRCDEVQYLKTTYMSLEELFSGFNTIKAITFSYNMSFINQIIGYFDYGEIIFGGDFLVQKDKEIANILATAYVTKESIKKFDNIISMVRNGNLLIKSSTLILDHRKLFILHADDGRTRVISTSANFSQRAWDGSQMEKYDFDDSIDGYEANIQIFDSAWELSDDIPYSLIMAKKTESRDDLIDGNPILKKVKEIGTAIIYTPAIGAAAIERARYAIDCDRLADDYKQIASSIKPSKVNDSVIEIKPKNIKSISGKLKTMLSRERAKIDNVLQDYPKLTIDYENRQVMLDDKAMNLYPSEKEVKHDIDELLKIFENFNDFIDDSHSLKPNHYKLMNAIFCSPFIAKVRCEAHTAGVGTSSLPLFLMTSSGHANCGKTFMISVFLKMMTGKDIESRKAADFKNIRIQGTKSGVLSSAECISTIQATYKGIPAFIDEIDNTYIRNVSGVIKNPEKCELDTNENMPMVIFASNNVLSPDEILRKRMIFIKFDASMPSNIDQSAYKSKGNAILRRLTNSLYREYLRRMIDAVNKLCDYMHKTTNIPDEYYPDLMAISSNILIDIFQDYGYEIPDYIKPLTWNGDYSVNAASISEEAVYQIEHLYKTNRKVFMVFGDNVIVELGKDSSNEKMCKSWENVLPKEIKTNCTPGRDSCRVEFNKIQLEKLLGHKIRTNKFAALFK